jgi:hypothetical protein
MTAVAARASAPDTARATKRVASSSRATIAAETACAAIAVAVASRRSTAGATGTTIPVSANTLGRNPWRAFA